MKRLMGMLLALMLLCGCGAQAPTVSERESALALPSIRLIEPMIKPGELPKLKPDLPAVSEPVSEPSSEPRWEPVSEPAGLPYYVRVNCQMNTVTVYTLDENRAYTVPYLAMVCSSGMGGSTPLGKYDLTGNRWKWMGLVGGVKGMYATQISGDYLFHSVPYMEWYDHGSLQPGEFDKLGQEASHGCIRLQVKDAKWIYDHMWEIEGVELYNSPDPGPLGKPSAPKIDGSEHPGWDPTDPDENNPWLAPPEPDPEPVEPPKPEPPEPEPPKPDPEPEPPIEPEVPDTDMNPATTPDPVPPTTAE